MTSEVVVLGLHRIGVPPREATIRGLFTTPGLLRFQVRLLRAIGYEFVTLRDAADRTRGKYAVITFDDGYADNFSEAFPILHSLGVPATLFVITNDVERSGVVWDEAGEKLAADILSWDAIRQLRDAGWEIGSHAHKHIHLERSSAAYQEETILRSLDIIEEKIGVRPVSFAYPYGTYNAATTTALDRLGVRYAVTTRPPAPGVTAMHLELPRISIGGRHFYHYVKNIINLANGVGKSSMISGMAYRFLTPSRVEASLLLPQINK